MSVRGSFIPAQRRSESGGEDGDGRANSEGQGAVGGLLLDGEQGNY